MSELYELPDGWELAEWKFIVNVKNGKDYKSVLNKNGLYPIYGSGGIINYADEYLCNENTVIIGRKGTINSPIFVKEKFWNIDTAFGLEANQDKLIPLFLYYFSLSFNFLTLNKSTTLPSLAKSNLQKILMPLPPLLEQKRIVSKLDSLFEKIDKAIALHQKNMDEGDAFMGSVLNDVFGELEEKYGVEKLKELIVMNYGKALKQADRIHGDVEVFGSNGVVGYHNESLIDYPTIIIGRKGSVGETNLSLGRSWTIDTAYYIDIIDNSRLDLFFIFYYTKIMDISDITQKGVKPGVNRNDYLDKFIPLPPLLIQQKVVKYLDEISEKIEKVKLVQNEKMESLKALKASILDKAFRGEL